jgi:hypothetical protein
MVVQIRHQRWASPGGRWGTSKIPTFSQSFCEFAQGGNGAVQAIPKQTCPDIVWGMCGLGLSCTQPARVSLTWHQ